MTLTNSLSWDYPLNLVMRNIPQPLILQLGTTSILMLVTTQKATFKALESIGQASEELFRGDRLPLLPFPDTGETTY